MATMTITVTLDLDREPTDAEKVYITDAVDAAVNRWKGEGMLTPDDEDSVMVRDAVASTKLV
jgi:hypothetical protein